MCPVADRARYRLGGFLIYYNTTMPQATLPIPWTTRTHSTANTYPKPSAVIVLSVPKHKVHEILNPIHYGPSVIPSSLILIIVGFAALWLKCAKRNGPVICSDGTRPCFSISPCSRMCRTTRQATIGWITRSKLVEEIDETSVPNNNCKKWLLRTLPA